MNYLLETSPLERLATDCIIVGCYENQHLSPSAKLLDSLNQGLISQLIARGDSEGKNGQTLLINQVPNGTIQRILLVGLGKPEKLTAKLYCKALSAAIKVLKKENLETVSCALAEIEINNTDTAWRARKIVEVFNDAIYQYKHTKSIKPPVSKLNTTHIMASDALAAEARRGVQQGWSIAKGVDLSKSLADLPGNICTPSYLAEQATKLADDSDKMTVEVLEESDMEALGMGSLLSVSRGSRQPAKLIVLNYSGGKAGDKPIVLVGKGLTFDAGGISLKPGDNMDEMKYDMCGGAGVLGTLRAAAEMQLELNVIGIVPSSENMPDGDANKPGDIVSSMAGLTIEVLNTDAEGRLILCDALTYAKKFNPRIVIDLATLTGACLIALGKVPSGLLGNDDSLCDALIAAGETAHDSVWRLPLWEEYHEQLKSNFADLANIGGRYAGAITAACFLSRFTEDYRWAHLDIAGTAWRTGDKKGATGRPVPLLSQYLIDQANAQS